MSDQWQVEPSRPGVLGRLLVPQSSTKPAYTAFLAGLAGAGAFVASLVLDWQKITIPEASSGSSNSGRAADEIVVTAGFGSVDVLGLVYVLGGLGLLTILGSVLVRPESALRMRMGAAGLGVGIVGVLVASTLRLKETIFNVQGIFGGLSSQMQQEMVERTEVAYEPGIFAAFAAVVLLAVAVWLAAAPAARAAARWADFAAANPAYAAYHAAQFHGGYAYPPPGESHGSVVPTQTGNGAMPPGPVPVPAPSYPPAAPPNAPLPASAYAPPPPPPLASTYAPAPPPPLASTYAPAPPPPLAATFAPAPAPPPASTYAPAPPTWSSPGHADELTVTGSEPLDPGTTPDVWRD